MCNSILYFSCPNKTSVSWWFFKVRADWLPNSLLSLSSTTALFLAQLNLVQNLIFKWLVASTQGFFTSQGDSLGGMMCQWNTGFEKKQSWSSQQARGCSQRKRTRKAIVQYIYAICSQAQPILSLKTVISFLFLESKFLMQLTH